MIIYKRKTNFKQEENRMKVVENIKNARNYFLSTKSKNLKFLLHKRFDWMNNHILETDNGIEIGSGAGFSKFFIKNKNLKLTDFGDNAHLDVKNIDAHDTKFNNENFDFVICSNVIHHLSYPLKFLKEMHRILKKNGKLIIFEPHMSLVFQIILNIMKHENYDFDANVWDSGIPICNPNDPFDSNAATINLLFDNKIKFEQNLGGFFSIEKDEKTECLIFLNSGGVTSKTYFIPMNDLMLKILNCVDNLLVKYFPNIFGMGRKIVLKKI